MATATGKVANDWIECLEKYGTGFNISLHVQLRFLFWKKCQRMLVITIQKMS